jgi:hypothetical protein
MITDVTGRFTVNRRSNPIAEQTNLLDKQPLIVGSEVGSTRSTAATPSSRRRRVGRRYTIQARYPLLIRPIVTMTRKGGPQGPLFSLTSTQRRLRALLPDGCIDAWYQQGSFRCAFAVFLFSISALRRTVVAQPATT